MVVLPPTWLQDRVFPVCIPSLSFCNLAHFSCYLKHRQHDREVDQLCSRPGAVDLVNANCDVLTPTATLILLVRKRIPGPRIDTRQSTTMDSSVCDALSFSPLVASILQGQIPVVHGVLHAGQYT